MKYLMESISEGKRLLIKTDSQEVRNHLNLVNFSNIRNNAKVMDVGSGVGIVSKIMSDMLKKAGKKAPVVCRGQNLLRLPWRNIRKMARHGPRHRL